MYIQWYPGHMTKAMRMMQDSLKTADCVIYVLDARVIRSSRNPAFDKMIKGLPVLYVFNKSDMVEKADLASWEKYYRERGEKCVSVNSVSSAFRAEVISKLAELNRPLIEKYRNKGVNKTVRAIVAGVPNTGKSTLINCLCGSKRTVTGNRPGVTRGKQWVKLASNIELLDTPGTLPPAFDDEERAVRLAMIGSIKEEVLDMAELGLEAIRFFKQKNYLPFAERYFLDSLEYEPMEIMDKIAKKRGYLLNKDNLDYERTARAILDDLRKLRLGRVMLDTADEIDV